MNERLTRTEIKRDELVEGLNQGVGYIHHHLKAIGIGIGVAALIALGYLGFRAYRAGGLEEANAALGQAQRVFGAPIDAAAAKPSDPDHPVFSTVEERRRRAEELFDAVRRDHGGEAGAVASAYLGRIAREKGNDDEARRLWTALLEEHPEGMMAAAVRLDLIHLDRQQGRSDAVVQQLEDMLRQDERVLPDDVILFELGRTLLELGRPSDARPYLQRILDEFPRSAYRTAAQQQLVAAGAPATG